MIFSIGTGEIMTARLFGRHLEKDARMVAGIVFWDHPDFFLDILGPWRLPTV
jgi:hypothetical protein